MCERFAGIWTVVILLIAIILLQGDILPSPFSTIRRGNSPCECLTGIFADNALRTALRRESLFIGIHWREARSRVVPFFDPWSLKYANCLSLHEFSIPLDGIELNTSTRKINGESSLVAVEEALRRQMEEDIADDGSNGNRKNSGLTIRDGGLFGVQRVWRGRGKISSSSAIERTPTCHVWILPETIQLPLEVWMTLRTLLAEGTLAGKSLYLTSDNNKRHKWKYYQPFGVLLWADPNDRESLKRMVPASTLKMFTTISR
ncbi:uncharacterized protein TM35_000311230 [Trypanosoma theileri]|uniref:Uncharacterized protein n=1 Tax=Trypanosoma theileri TaxID=67003 RepID=A0A1X0NMN1_9TRYP|nr:uncharacterized protein TM35_000311230 [Trypanosoma theileri]ORC85937.1 hypothetical protein TM35_000311230 [Trypanosoma theileri]